MIDFTPQASDCLLVIDVQNDFCEGGALAVPDADSIIPVVNACAERFQNVVFTQDWHPEGHSSFASVHEGKQPFESISLSYGEQTLWPDHCVIGSHGAEFHAQLDTSKPQLILRKGFRQAIDSYSAFFENDHKTPTGLSQYLQERGIERIVCVGLALDYCVKFSAIDGRHAGFSVLVLEAACRGINMDNSNITAKEQMLQQGVEIR